MVLSLCPSSLKGILSTWFFEIATNVFVGNVSVRVRDELWQRVVSSIKEGKATMIYSINNEQGFDFRVAGDTWVPIDYDGLMFMLRPFSKKQTE